MSETGPNINVIISGAGIAGLSVAIALQKLPFIHVELFERRATLEEIGASIALTPNVMHGISTNYCYMYTILQ